MTRKTLWLGAAALAAMAALAACQPGQRATKEVPPQVEAALIERAALFGNPERTQARIAPGGDYVSFLAPTDGYLNVFVIQAGADLSSARQITTDAKRGVRQHFWAENGTEILYLQDEGGDENWRLYAVEVATGTRRDLTPLAGVQAQVVGMSPREPDAVMVALNDRDKRWHTRARAAQHRAIRQLRHRSGQSAPPGAEIAAKRRDRRVQLQRRRRLEKAV
jgi:hypothetical protein